MPKSSNRFTIKKIKDFLNKTGFPFEMKITKLLNDIGWTTFQGESFLDLDNNVRRETDIIAMKTINDVKVHLIIECKASARDSWIFITPNSKMSRYYSFVKYTPNVDYKQFDKFKKFTDNLIIMNSPVEIANNYISFDGNKKSDTTHIKEAVYKTIKAMLYCASEEYSEEERKIYIPIVVFSAPIFIAKYSNNLKINKTNYSQYYYEFDAKKYGENVPKSNHDIFDIFNSFKNHITNICGSFGNEYLIEFISQNNLKSYILKLESDINNSDSALWILPKNENA